MIILSIITVTKDSGSLLSDCVESIMKEMKAFKDTFEIIIVDNASTDQSIKSILKKNISSITLIQNSNNVGFSRANNQAIRKAKGEYILFVNPDVILKKGCLIDTFKFLNSHPNAGAVGCRLVNSDDTWQRSCGHFPSLKREFIEAFAPRFLLRSSLLNGVHHYKENLEVTEVDWISGAYLFTKKEALLKSGLFDEAFFLYYEDIDLCRRIKDAGFKIYFFPDTEAVHIMAPKNKISSARLIDNGESPYIYFRKHFSKKTVGALWVTIVIKTTLRVIFFSAISLFKTDQIYSVKLKSNWMTLKFNLGKRFF